MLGDRCAILFYVIEPIYVQTCSTQNVTSHPVLQKFSYAKLHFMVQYRNLVLYASFLSHQKRYKMLSHMSPIHSQTKTAEWIDSCFCVYSSHYGIQGRHFSLVLNGIRYMKLKHVLISFTYILYLCSLLSMSMRFRIS